MRMESICNLLNSEKTGGNGQKRVIGPALGLEFHSLARICIIEASRSLVFSSNYPDNDYL